MPYILGFFRNTYARFSRTHFQVFRMNRKIAKKKNLLKFRTNFSIDEGLRSYTYVVLEVFTTRTNRRYSSSRFYINNHRPWGLSFKTDSHLPNLLTFS